MRTYDIVSEIAGTVIQKELTAGEFVRDDKSDFYHRRSQHGMGGLNVYRQDFPLLHEGSSVSVLPDEGAKAIESTIAYLSPIGSEDTQTTLARLVVPNPQGDLKPGLFVRAQAMTGEVDAPVAVKVTALQKIKDKTVVFVKKATSSKRVKLKPANRTADSWRSFPACFPATNTLRRTVLYSRPKSKRMRQRILTKPGSHDRKDPRFFHPSTVVRSARHSRTRSARYL